MDVTRGIASVSVLAVVALALLSSGAAATPPQAGIQVYANDERWVSFGTATFRGGPEHSFDRIYVFPGTSLVAVGEASPGDPDYNGGRWDVRAVTFTGIAPTQFTNDEDLLDHYALGHLEISETVMRFECPLLRL